MKNIVATYKQRDLEQYITGIAHNLEFQNWLTKKSLTLHCLMKTFVYKTNFYVKKIS